MAFNPFAPSGPLAGSNPAGTNPGEVSVPGFFCHASGAFRALSAPQPVISSPADDGIQASAGDDVSAPNAVTAARLNRVVCVSSANVGYSETAKDTEILPSALEYDATISEGSKSQQFALTLRMTLEFENCFPSEGMMVWLKKYQQCINDEKISELLLIDTEFQDYVNGSWIPITTDIRYTEEAEAVVQAVITSESGQTAGKVSTKDCIEDAKLGPVGERGRIVLTYFCDNLYSYAEMALASQNQKEHSAATLVPLALQIPWAAVDNPGNACRVNVTVRGPAGSRLLDTSSNILAYRDLQKSLVESSKEEIQTAIIPSAVSGQVSAWEFSRTSLPPSPTMVLSWLSIPDADDGWEHVDLALPKTTRAVLLQPRPEDEHLLRVALPGGQQGHLIRCKVETEAPARRPDSIRLHTDITISDASGSTGMRSSSGSSCVRSDFNAHEERRLLKRLEAIPKLREAGILLPQDVWRQIFVIFDHGVKHEFGIESKVQDLDATTVELLLKAVRNNDVSALSQLQAGGKQSLVQSWADAIKCLRGVSPGGATSFVEGTNRAKTTYLASPKIPNAESTTYVNFDTDGGNNCGPCYEAIRQLTDEADVVAGHVLGIGSWVDQDCASRVARILKGTVHLALSFPDDAACDEYLRKDLSTWIRVLRSSPVTVKCSAGAVSWAARHGHRNENAADCLFAAGEGVRFDDPDVSEDAYTKSVLKGLKAGESTTLYMLSRIPPSHLSSRMELDVGGVRATVTTSFEPLQGIILGHHWLSLLGGKLSESVVKNASTTCTRLCNRFEDDLSFAWNLPSTSGSTAAMGRAKTQNRPPVRKDQQPIEPELPELPVRSWGNKGGPFFGTPAMLRGGKGRSCFFGGGGAPASAAFGGGGAPGSALFGGGGGGGGLFGSVAAAQPAPAMASAFGSAFGSAAPVPQMAGKGGGKGSSKAKKGFSFGGAGAGNGSGGLFGGPVANSSAPLTPHALLDISGHMRCGDIETPHAAFNRGMAAVKQLVSFAVQGAASPLPAEDPLVGSILGSAPSANTDTQAVHYGFHCDATGQSPIIGIRYKATSKQNIDVNAAARKAGNFAGGAGFRVISTRAHAMRLALAAILDWWWVIWPNRFDLFSNAMPQLQTLNEAALSQAISKLPNAP